MKLNANKVQELADRLQGTCDSVDLDALTVEECRELDSLVFLCAQCGWWCEAHEANEGPGGEDICDDCHSENESD